jgi:hypothetical protein
MGLSMVAGVGACLCRVSPRWFFSGNELFNELSRNELSSLMCLVNGL